MDPNKDSRSVYFRYLNFKRSRVVILNKTFTVDIHISYKARTNQQPES